MVCLDDRRLIAHLHGNFPLCDRPFAAVAQALNTASPVLPRNAPASGTVTWVEEGVIERLRVLLVQGVLTRFGPLFQIERAGGQFVLAAMSVSVERFESVVSTVNTWPEVAHNYQRDHALNLWFVVAAESAEAAQRVLTDIEHETELTVWAFPKEREYGVELRLPLLDAAESPAVELASTQARTSTRSPVCSGHGPVPLALTPFDRQLITATQGGLPLVARPYEAVGAMLGVSGEAVAHRLERMEEEGLIRRIGAVPHHYRLGFTANGMSVWDVDDAQVDALGAQVAALPGVSHCYRRPRHRPQWPYNLFAMVHGRSRGEVDAQLQRIKAVLGEACRANDVLFSTAVLKKTGLRLSAAKAL